MVGAVSNLGNYSTRAMSFSGNMCFSRSFVSAGLYEFGNERTVLESIKSGQLHSHLWPLQASMIDRAQNVRLFGYCQSSKTLRRDCPEWDSEVIGGTERVTSSFRKRQAAYITASMGLFATPIAYRISMEQFTFNNVRLTSKYWTLQNFGLELFCTC